MTQHVDKKARLLYILSMVVFGTVGIFRRFIPLDSGLIAMIRGLLGGLFILFFLMAVKRPFRFSHLKGKLVHLLFIGGVIGFNWVALFEAYRYTSVATATLCYYMQPIFLILVSPFLFKEKLSWKKAVCVIIAFAGMVLVSGILKVGVGSGDLRGVIFGLISALLYAFVIAANKLFTGDLDPYEKTMIELFAAGLAVAPYLALRGVFTSPETAAGFTGISIILLLVLGIFHTGITYVCYFGSLDKIRVQQAALFGYFDPVVAVILSQLILHETMTPLEWVGAVLIIGAAAVSEFI